MSFKVLVTTPDYLPRKGGLTTYTIDLVEALREANYDVDIYHWKKISDLKLIKHQRYEKIININYTAGYLGDWDRSKNINIIHGSEILFHSNNLLKKIYKKIFKRRIITFFEKSQRNIFISEFTRNKLVDAGFKIDYFRDIIFHNCINTNNGEFVNNDIGDLLKVCCVVRDTPHKNIHGAISLLEELSEYLNLKVQLSLNSERYSSSIITIKKNHDLSDVSREELYRESHFNILLSLDHSSSGYYEGFGLTCLEAGKYGVPSIVSRFGGLPENVHDGLNGIVFDDRQGVDDFCERIKILIGDYSNTRKNTYEHTINSHGRHNLKKLLEVVL